jgi:hypothetical protein
MRVQIETPRTLDLKRRAGGAFYSIVISIVITIVDRNRDHNRDLNRDIEPVTFE